VNRRILVRYAVLSALACICASAQQALAPEVLQKLTGLADQVKVALEAGDVANAEILASRLMLGVTAQRQAAEPTPQQALASLEQSGAQGQGGRFALLPRLAVAAFNAGELNQAESYAQELLASASDSKNWNYGNAIFFGNMIIGRVALRRDKNISQAQASLLAAGHTPGSPQLNSFGPNMSLAKDLIEAGDRDTVLEFFQLCRVFWKMDYKKLDGWIAMVKGGGTPDFGANLVYD